MTAYLILAGLALSGWVLFLVITLLFDRYGIDMSKMHGGGHRRPNKRRARREKFGKGRADPVDTHYHNGRTEEEMEELLSR